jgi:hypothetical protein
VEQRGEPQWTRSSHAIHFALNQPFAVGGRQSFIVFDLHITWIVRMVCLHLSELAHIEGFIQTFYKSFDQNELIEMFFCLIVILGL